MDRPNHPEKGMLSPREAESILGVSRRTLMRWEAKGLIQPRRLPSGYRRFVREEVEALLGGEPG